MAGSLVSCLAVPAGSDYGEGVPGDAGFGTVAKGGRAKGDGGAELECVAGESEPGGLAEVPLEKCFLGLRREDAQKSLMDLSVGVFTDRTVRHMVGARLVGGLKTEVPYDLECLLQETEYLPKKFARHVK